MSLGPQNICIALCLNIVRGIRELQDVSQAVAERLGDIIVRLK